MWLLAFCWRNLWRNKIRSGIIIGAIASGLTGGMLTFAFMKGLSDQYVHSAIATEVSHIQLHHPQFLLNREWGYRIPATDSVIAAIARRPQVAAISKRLITSAMAGSPQTAAGVNLEGVVDSTERSVTDLCTRLIAGDYFGSASNQILIGARLSRKLQVGLRGKIVLTLQRADGELTGGAFRIAGIFHSDNSMFEETQVFIRFDELRQLAGLDHEDAHEIAIRLYRDSETDAQTQALAQSFPNLRVQSWKEVKPELAMMSGVMDQMLYLFLVIIMIALAFGIINTMLMALFERRREFGLLLAIGMKKRYILRMILSETLLLSLIGATAGVCAATALVLGLGRVGINLSAFSQGLSAMGYSPRVFPALHPEFYLVLTGLVIITAAVASIYPVYWATGVQPAEAIRNE